MPRAKWHLDVDVVTAARERIEHIYDVFDSTVVMFSGGKDSGACLQLVREFHEQNGLGKVNVVFRHEEVINPSILEYVEEFRHKDWMDLYWFCLPMKNSKYVLGRKEPYIEWDPDREWVGEQPEWAITAHDLGVPADGSLNQNNVDETIAKHLGLKGKIAYITGVRASESLVRFRSVTQKLNENYISSIEGNARSAIKLCKPIYDWQERDVLKFLYETGTGWCPVYEAQDLAGVGLRVSTALHVVAAKKIDRMAAMEPEFWQRIIEVFPEMQDQARYDKEFDKKGMVRKYLDRGFEGVYEYVENEVPEENKPIFLERAALWKRRWEKDPENYPINLLIETMAFGTVKQRMAGVYVDSKAAQKGKKK